MEGSPPHKAPSGKPGPPVRAQFVALVASRVSAVLVQALTFAVISRSVTLLTFGRLGFVTSSLVVVSTVFDFGISTLLAKSVAREHFALAGSLVRLNAMLTIVGVLTMTGLTAAITVHLGEDLWAVLLVPAVMLEKNVETNLSVPIAMGRKATPAISLLARRLITLTAALVGCAAHLHVLDSYAIGYLIAATCAQLHLRRWIARSSQVRGRAGPVRAVLRQSLPYFISNITVQSRSLDAPLTGTLAAPPALSFYSASTRLIGPFLLIPQVAADLIVPHSARVTQLSAWVLMRRVALVLCAVSAALTPLLHWAPLVLTVVYGPRYRAAASCFAAMAISMPFIAGSSSLGSILQGQHQQRFVAVNGSVFLGITLISITVGALTAGATGVAVAIGVTFMLKCASLMIKGRRALL